MPHSILDLITERQAIVAATIATLREQIGKLTDEPHTAETELRPGDHLHHPDPADKYQRPRNQTRPSENTAYQQILAMFTTSNSPTMRAQDVCHALGIDTAPKDTEGIRAKLKRLVKRRSTAKHILKLFGALGAPRRPGLW
jgi:hypothetical protein